MVAILFSSFFCLLWYRYKTNNGNCVGSWLLLWYAISSILSLLENYINPINNDYLDEIATLYYVLCQIIAIFPFLLLGKYDCRNFRFNHQLFTYLAYVLIIFGSVKLVNSLVYVIDNFAKFLYNIADVRNSFYDSFLISTEITAFEKLSIIINNLQYMSPFLAFYFLCRGDKRMSILLFIISLSQPIGQIVHGEREGSLKYIVNVVFCFIFYNPIISNKTKRKIKRVIISIVSPFILFIVAMTIGRFSDYGDNGVLDSLFLYGGDQPFYFSHIFNDKELLSQLQYGRINFQYFFPTIERVQGQVNLYISTDFYLNQFGGLPGSFFLDFGYSSILIILAFSVAYYILIKIGKKHLLHDRFPLCVLFLFYFSFQVLYMNIYYFDFPDLFGILFTVVFFVMCCFWPGSYDYFEGRNG